MAVYTIYNRLLYRLRFLSTAKKNKIDIAVCPLVSYHIMLGKKWHEDLSMPKHYRTNVITVRRSSAPSIFPLP